MANLLLASAWSDLHPDLALGANGDIKLVQDIEAVYASIENILLTMMGERVMLRDFAANIRNLLFEPMIDKVIRNHIGYEFKTAIQMWEPRVLVRSISVKHNSDRSELYIIIEFCIKGNDKVFTFDKTLRK